MSAVTSIGIRLDWAESMFDRVQTVGEDTHGLVAGDGYTISGTPDQLLDLAALLVDAANLVLAAEREVAA